MAVKRIWSSSEKSKHTSKLEAYMNARNEIFIRIFDSNQENFICLDKWDAIKLVKHIRSEISKIKDDE